MAEIIEISKRVKPFKVDIKDPNFFRPISELYKDYSKEDIFLKPN